MSEDRMDRFDLEVRSMLSDAEEKVPSGAWKAVSSRLDAASAPGRTSAWGWAVAGLAFASFAAAFIVGGVRGGAPVPVGDPVAVVEPAALVETVSPAGDSVLEETIVGIFDAAPRQSVLADAGRRQDGTAPAAVEESSRKEPAQEEVATRGSSRSTVDEFARMALEDSRHKASTRGWSFDFGGSVAGSEDSRSLIASRTSGVTATSLRDRITETSTSTFGIPFTVGLGARYYMNKRFSVATGIDFSLLTRTFTGQYTPVDGTMTEGDINHSVIYLGVPVNFYFDILKSSVVKFYTFAGGEAEYGVVNKYHIREIDKFVYDPVEGVQFSVGLGFGCEFKVSRRLGIYIDPCVNYYFNNNQPKSIRTERPMMFNLDAGLRFNL